jgi:hypothetical protein
LKRTLAVADDTFTMNGATVKVLAWEKSRFVKPAEIVPLFASAVICK